MCGCGTKYISIVLPNGKAEQMFKRGDTIFETTSRTRFFMPEISLYRGINYIEGEYFTKKNDYHFYQSVLRNCRMVLVEKTTTYRSLV